MLFHENRLPADDSHETSWLIYSEKEAKFEIVFCCKLKVALYGLSMIKSCGSLALCMMDDLNEFLSSNPFFLEIKSFRNSIRVSNKLDPDQERHIVHPDLGSNSLQSLSAANKSHCL